MLKDITIEFDFKGVGHGNISVFPGNYCQPYLQDNSGSKIFSLNPGDYLLRIEGVVSIDGAFVRVAEGANTLGTLNLPTGYFSLPLNFTVS